MAAALTASGHGFNPFGRAWSAYERSLRRHPILTQAASSALLWGLGDAVAQRIESRGRGGTDSRRVALTAAFGGAVIGPTGHGWYMMLEKLVMQLGLACSMKSMLVKVAFDNLLFSPLYVLSFFAFGCLAIDGLSPGEFATKMREEFMPTMLAEAMVWPPYMCWVFSRVPVKHQLLAVNAATLLDVVFLSWMRTKDEAHHQDNVGQLEAQAIAKEQPKELKAIKGSQQRRAQAQARLSGGGAKAAQQRQEREQRVMDEFGEVVRSRDAAVAALWPWDAPSTEENLGRMALMAASATCSTVGGGGFWGMRPSVAASAGAAASR